MHRLKFGSKLILHLPSSFVSSRVTSPPEEKNWRMTSIMEEFKFYYGQGEDITIMGNNEPQTLYP